MYEPIKHLRREEEGEKRRGGREKGKRKKERGSGRGTGRGRRGRKGGKEGERISSIHTTGIAAVGQKWEVVRGKTRSESTDK